MKFSSVSKLFKSKAVKSSGSDSAQKKHVYSDNEVIKFEENPMKTNINSKTPEKNKQYPAASRQTMYGLRSKSPAKANVEEAFKSNSSFIKR